MSKHINLFLMALVAMFAGFALVGCEMAILDDDSNDSNDDEQFGDDDDSDDDDDDDDNGDDDTADDDDDDDDTVLMAWIPDCGDHPLEMDMIYELEIYVYPNWFDGSGEDLDKDGDAYVFEIEQVHNNTKINGELGSYEIYDFNWEYLVYNASGNDSDPYAEYWGCWEISGDNGDHWEDIEPDMELWGTPGTPGDYGYDLFFDVEDAVD